MTRLPFLLFLIGFYTGFRFSDFRFLKFEDFDGDYLIVKEKKTGKPRSVAINDTLREGVNFCRYRFKCDGSDYIFWEKQRIPKNLGGKIATPRTAPLSISGATQILRRYFKKHNIDGHPSTHTLRKTFGMRVYENNDRSEDALILLSIIYGHSDPGTTRTYLGLYRGSMRVQRAYLNL